MPYTGRDSHSAFLEAVEAELVLLDQFSALAHAFHEQLGSQIPQRHLDANAVAATKARLQELLEQAQRLQSEMQAIHRSYYTQHPPDCNSTDGLSLDRPT